MNKDQEDEMKRSQMSKLERVKWGTMVERERESCNDRGRRRKREKVDKAK